MELYFAKPMKLASVKTALKSAGLKTRQLDQDTLVVPVGLVEQVLAALPLRSPVVVKRTKQGVQVRMVKAMTATQLQGKLRGDYTAVVQGHDRVVIHEKPPIQSRQVNLSEVRFVLDWDAPLVEVTRHPDGIGAIVRIKGAPQRAPNDPGGRLPSGELIDTGHPQDRYYLEHSDQLGRDPKRPQMQVAGPGGRRIPFSFNLRRTSKGLSADEVETRLQTSGLDYDALSDDEFLVKLNAEQMEADPRALARSFPQADNVLITASGPGSLRIKVKSVKALKPGDSVVIIERGHVAEGKHGELADLWVEGGRMTYTVKIGNLTLRTTGVQPTYFTPSQLRIAQDHMGRKHKKAPAKRHRG